MNSDRDGLPFDVLVELIAALDSQTCGGLPEARIEGRISGSVGLARRAGYRDLRIKLDRRDFNWFCAARRVDPESSSALGLRVDTAMVSRAPAALESHIVGRWKLSRERMFPIIAEPTLSPGFVQYITSEAEKSNLLEQFQDFVARGALKDLRRSKAN